MSSGNIKNIFQNQWNKLPRKAPEPEFDLTPAIIPFSKFFGRSKAPDIYNGQEFIPFKNREKEFQLVLRQEFSSSLKEYKK